MSYMIEGGGSPTLSRAKAWLYRDPAPSHALLQALTDVCVDFLEGQVRAGAQLLQVFESHAGLLGAEQFDCFCLPYLKQIAAKLKARTLAKNLPQVPMVRMFIFFFTFSLEYLACNKSLYAVCSSDCLCKGRPLCPRQPCRE